MKLDVIGALERSGLSQREMADYLGVSRPTMNKWCNDRCGVHSLLVDRVSRRLEFLDQLVDAGELPVRAPRRSTRRKEVLAELLAGADETA